MTNGTVKMGHLFSKVFDNLVGSRERRILILGLDNAGKTTILYRLQRDEVIKTVPTVGFNVETVQYKNIKFQVWDLGGQTAIRPYWRCYYPNTDCVIYVVDSADRDRLTEDCKNELHLLLEEEELQKKPLLVFANKQDLDGAVPPAELANKLELARLLSNHTWTIQGSSAVKQTGLTDGLGWIVDHLKK